MRVKTIQDEDFLNYRKPAMLICCISCNGKCSHEYGFDPKMCQNAMWADEPTIEIEDKAIVARYLNNRLTTAIVFGGLEPFEQIDEVVSLISLLRAKTDDDIVIYTGYREDEVEHEIELLKCFTNIIVKFGRFIPNLDSVIDPVLGVKLISNNQYAKKIS